MISGSLTYQFHVVSATLCANSVGLKIGQYPHTQKFTGWMDCWSYLYKRQQLKRGSSIIGRYYVGPTIYVNGSPRPLGYSFGPAHSKDLYLNEKQS